MHFSLGVTFDPATHTHPHTHGQLVPQSDPLCKYKSRSESLLLLLHSCGVEWGSLGVSADVVTFLSGPRLVFSGGEAIKNSSRGENTHEAVV